MKIDTNKMIYFLQNKWGDSICPYCHGNNWDVPDKAFELREFNKGDLKIGGPEGAILPVVPITCTNCGNTVFINALLAGLVEEN